MIRIKISENNLLTLLSRANIILTLLLTLAGSLFVSPQFSTGILLGSVLSIANFYWLKYILQRALLLHPVQAQRFIGLRYVIRLTILAVVILLLVNYAKVDILGLLAGLSVLVINIIALSIFMSLKGG